MSDIPEFWHRPGNGGEAYAQITDARLCVISNALYRPWNEKYPRYGWRWCVIPRKGFCGPMDIENPYQSLDICSEAEPYPTIEAAQDACLNFYVREFHPEYDCEAQP